ncbi:MAG: sulfatase [Kiritimatiellales bacterium]
MCKFDIGKKYYRKNAAWVFSAVLALSAGGAIAQDRRPNILFCILDDASWKHMSAYGCKWVDTPAFDRLAKDGILFNNAYTPNAKCAPSRACILTGRNSWQLEEAANHVCNFPAKFKTFPEVLREHGYITAQTGKGWGPGYPGKVDGELRLLVGTSFDTQKYKQRVTTGISPVDYAANFEQFLDSTDGKQPWFFWFGAREPHRAYEYGTGKSKGGRQESDIDHVPAFWPDDETVRNDMLDYGFEIEHADRNLGRMLALLEQRNLLQNTLVIMTSDNGMPFPRCKGQEYEYSNHMPLAAMWPDGIRSPGRTVDDMISFIDLAPTFLDVAGIPFEQSGMADSPGKSLQNIFQSDKSGQVDPDRRYVLIGRERHDFSRPQNQSYPIRGIVGNGFLYLYTYDLDRWPAGNPELGYLDCDGSPTKTDILNLFRSGTNRSYWDLSFGKRMVHEELFDLSADSECMVNLAGDERFRQLEREMKDRMDRGLKEQNDPRMFGHGDVFDHYGYADTLPEAWNFYEQFMAGRVTPKDTGWVNPSDYERKPIE